METGMAMAMDTHNFADLTIGDKITFRDEKQAYTIRATNNRWSICTKPFNLKRTVLYTIIDWKQNVRGTENLIFEAGFETDEQCAEALQRLSSGETAVSHRNYCQLSITNIARRSHGHAI